jgi:hypothetical protein
VDTRELEPGTWEFGFHEPPASVVILKKVSTQGILSLSEDERRAIVAAYEAAPVGTKRKVAASYGALPGEIRDWRDGLSPAGGTDLAEGAYERTGRSERAYWTSYWAQKKAMASW